MRNYIEDELNAEAHKMDGLLSRLEEVNKALAKQVRDSGLTVDQNGGRSEWTLMPLKEVEKFKSKAPRPDPDWRYACSHEFLKEYGLGKVPEKDKDHLPGGKSSGNSNNGTPAPDLEHLSGEGSVFVGANASPTERKMIQNSFKGKVKQLEGMPEGKPHQTQGKKNKQHNQGQNPPKMKDLDLE